MTRDTWLSERRSGLGSSDVPVILGLSPLTWGGPHRVWLAKHDALPPESPEPHLVYGQHADGAILDYVAEAHGLTLLRQRNVAHRHETERWALASPDSLLVRDGVPVGVVEAKNYGSGDGWGRDGDDADDETVPAHVLAQTMHQMWVTGLRGESYIAASLWGRAPRLYPVRWDPSYETHVVPVLRAWWRRHIVEGEPPPVDASDACARTLSLVYPGDPTRERVQRDDLAELAERVLAAKDEARRADEAARLAENMLRAALADDDRALAGAVSVTRVRQPGRARLDGERLREWLGGRWADAEQAATVIGAPYEYLMLRRRKAREG